MVSTLDRLTYAARQTARVAWYAGHYAAGRRLLKPMPKPDFPIGPTPSRAEMTADMRALFEREWQDIAAGLFPAPRARGPEPAEFLRRSLRYFRDLPQVDARRHGQRDDTAAGRAGRRPARLLPAELPFPERRLAQRTFGGDLRHPGRGAVHRRRRRHAPPRLQADRRLDGRPQPARPRGLDVGCGTGRLLAFLHDAWPGLKLTGLDLSAPYLAEARRLIGRTARVKLIEGKAETLPFDDAQPRSRGLVLPDARAAPDDRASGRSPRWRAS